MKNEVAKLTAIKTEFIPQDEATALIAQAIDKGTDVATMEKLLAMRTQLKAEKAKEQFDQAMAGFQSECPTIQKKTQGYNYKYADLTTIVEQIKGILAKYGFSYTFDTDDVENTIVVSCKVKHTGGHMEVSKATITRETTTKMNASQQSGAAMTYGKRYAFVNAFGLLTGDEDNDAATTHYNVPMKPYVKSPTVVPQPLEKKKADYSTLAKKVALAGSLEDLRSLYGEIAKDYQIDPDQVKLLDMIQERAKLMKKDENIEITDEDMDKISEQTPMI